MGSQIAAAFRRTWFLSFLFLTVSSKAMPEPEGFRQLPLHLAIGDFSGSGFLFKSTNSIFLVTARHVLFDVTAQGARLLGTNLTTTFWMVGKSEPATIDVDLSLASANREIRVHPSRDIAIVRVATETNGIQFLPGITTHNPEIRLRLLSFGTVARIDSITNFSDAVCVFGYPSVGSRFVQGRINPTRPLLRRGAVADVDLERKLIVLDTPVFGGNSGGPAIELERKELPGAFSFEQRILGVVIEYVPFEDVWTSQRKNPPQVTWQNSGYAIVEPMDFVLELLWD
jgi:S1-C subfamily serine protease